MVKFDVHIGREDCFKLLPSVYKYVDSVAGNKVDTFEVSFLCVVFCISITKPK